MPFTPQQLQRLEAVRAAAEQVANEAGALESLAVRLREVEQKTGIVLTDQQVTDAVARVLAGKAAVDTANDTLQAA